jgi:PAT family beta-lactamase induction signal transducer AmpG
MAAASPGGPGPPPGPRPLRSLGALLLLGVASGVPFDLGQGTLQSWLTEAGWSLADLGLLSLAGLPYVLKPVWSPLLDRFTAPPPFDRLGRRRGWMALAQLGCVAVLAAMAVTPPEGAVGPGGTRSEGAVAAYAVLAVALAFFSASQDIGVDAWRTDALPAASRGLGAALASWGYRLGMLCAGFLTPVLAVTAGLGWGVAYGAMAALMATGLLATLLAPREPPTEDAPRTLAEAVILPLRALLTRERALAFLALVLAYKLGDAFASSLFSAFLQRGLAFRPDEVAALRKTVGVAAIFVGMGLGGVLMMRLRLSTALLAFGLLQALTNLGFLAIADHPRDLIALGFAIVGENLATGLGSVAFVALLTALCDRRFSALQYALLSSLAALGSRIAGPVAGPTAETLGWAGFYAVSTAVAVPGLLLAFWLRRAVNGLDAKT